MIDPFLRFSQELASIQEHGFERRLRRYDREDARTIVIEGRSFLNFSSNDYLGLSTHPDVIGAAVESTRIHGTGGRASRLVSGESPFYEDLESALAEYKETETALVFSSGYHANLALVSLLMEDGGTVFLDRLCHASLVDAARLSGGRVGVYAHCDPDNLRKSLSRRSGPAVIVTDGVFSMDGDIAPLPELALIAEEYGAWLLVDDAHATGVLGPGGRGTAAHFNVHSDRMVLMGTLSKALGCLGGIFAGKRLLREMLVNRARSLIYTTALPPGVIAGAAAAVRLAMRSEDRRSRLRRHGDRVRQAAHDLGYDTRNSETPIIPIVLGEESVAMKASKILSEHGIHAPAIRPPTVPKGTARLRLSLTALHEDGDVDCLIEALKAVKEAS